MEGDYTVRLVFAEPDEVAAGGRVFNVSVQGEVVVSGLDIVKRTGGAKRVLEIELPNVKAREAIDVTFTSSVGQPLICGVEVVVGAGS